MGYTESIFELEQTFLGLQLGQVKWVSRIRQKQSEFIFTTSTYDPII